MELLINEHIKLSFFTAEQICRNAGVSTMWLMKGVGGTTYHMFLIEKDADNTIDIGFDTSIIAANLPAGYTKYRRIGSIVTDVTANIRNFIHRDDDFMYATPVLDEDVVDSGALANLITATCPIGINVKLKLNIWLTDNSKNLYLSSPDTPDLAPSGSVAPLGDMGTGGSSNLLNTSTVWTNTSAQFRYRMNSGTLVRIATVGYTDRRGR